MNWLRAPAGRGAAVCQAAAPALASRDKRQHLSCTKSYLLRTVATNTAYATGLLLLLLLLLLVLLLLLLPLLLRVCSARCFCCSWPAQQYYSELFLAGWGLRSICILACAAVAVAAAAAAAAGGGAGI